MHLSGTRALLLVVLAASISAGAVAVLLTAPTARATGGQDVVVGQRELVRMTGPDGTTIEVTATVDTGAGRSSIDDDVARDLGIDPGQASTITVQSALGEEERPVAPVAFQVAGRTQVVEVSINDRAELTDPVLVGRDQLGDVLVAPDQAQLTTPAAPTPPSPLRAVLAARSASLTPGGLLALLPLAALVIVVLRQVVGFATLGTFTPVLLTLGVLQVGFVPALVLTAAVVGLGLALEPALRRVQMPRVARLGALIALAAFLLLLLEQVTGLHGAADSWGAAFPLVVSAGLVERIYEVLGADGWGDALRDTASTIGVAAAAVPVLLSPPVRHVAETAPAALALASLVLALVAGSYRGLRMNEVVRFERTADGAEVSA